MTADHIAFHATERPDAVALIDRDRAITFSAFRRDIRKLTRAVAELGVPRGGSVAVGADDLYTHWLLLLACERLGIAAASFLAGEPSESAAQLADVDLVLAEPHFPEVGARRHHAITREWLEHAFALDGEHDDPAPSRAPDDPVRILRTSGTTASPKRILHPRSLHDAWVTRWIVMSGLTRRSRLLLTMPFSVNGMYACATACLRAGGTVVAMDLPESRDIARAIADHAITALILVPIQIGGLLDALPDGFAKPAGLTLCCFGATVSGALRRPALARLATDLIDMYGSNEAGFIASTGASRDDGVSAIWPGVRVEIVDEYDAPVPSGQSGRIRVKTPDMVQGYLANDEATARIFRDGWFYPGDIGVLHGPRVLRVLGRGDDLLNLGGRKLPPEIIEQMILGSLALGDVGVCSTQNAQGIEELLVGIVHAPYDDSELLKRLNSVLVPLRIGGFRAVRLPQIPRNANGKIQRDRLSDAIRDAIEIVSGAR